MKLGQIDYFKYTELIVVLTFFGSKIPFLVKIGPRSQSNLLKTKLGVYTSSNMAAFGGDFPLACFQLEISFLSKFSPKIQNCLRPNKVHT